MSKLKVSHIVETSVWIAIISVFFAFSFEFDQEIEIYIFGATGWPRAVLGILLLVVLGILKELLPFLFYSQEMVQFLNQIYKLGV